MTAESPRKRAADLKFSHMGLSVTQPFLIPLDLAKSDAEIYRETRALCEASEGFEPLADWRERIARRMTAFVP